MNRVLIKLSTKHFRWKGLKIVQIKVHQKGDWSKKVEFHIFKQNSNSKQELCSMCCPERHDRFRQIWTVHAQKRRINQAIPQPVSHLRICRIVLTGIIHLKWAQTFTSPFLQRPNFCMSMIMCKFLPSQSKGRVSQYLRNQLIELQNSSLKGVLKRP